MGVGEPPALRGQPVQPGRSDLRPRILAPQITVPQVVGQNENDVGACLPFPAESRVTHHHCQAVCQRHRSNGPGAPSRRDRSPDTAGAESAQARTEKRELLQSAQQKIATATWTNMFRALVLPDSQKAFPNHTAAKRKGGVVSVSNILNTVH